MTAQQPAQPEQRNDFGWPVRMREDGVRVCARPGPGHYSAEEEFRIDGYCSCECRDFHELEQENARLVRERDEFKDERDALEELRRKMCADLATARDERDEYKECFALEVDAVARGIKMWQAAHPGNDLRWPDKGALVAWTLGHLSAARARLDSARAILESAKIMKGPRQHIEFVRRIDSWLLGGEETT